MFEINYQIEKTQFGFMLMVTYQHDLCAVEFSDDEAPLITGLTRKFSSRDGVNFTQFLKDEQLVKDIMAVVELGESKTIPYRMLGTPFQMQVWKEILQIPKGSFKTYGQIAAAIGRPNSHRAVGNACNANHLGVIVPCHRVVPADGSMGKYAWGEGMKGILLKREGIDINNFKFVMKKPKKFKNAHEELCWHEDKNFFKIIDKIVKDGNKI